jgi:homoserine kinase type II
MGTFRTLSASDIDEILGHFGLPGHQSSTPISAGTVNTNYAVTGADGQPRLFLRINEGKAGDDVVREGAIVNHLAARGVKTPRPLVATTGEPFARWRDVFVSIFPFVDGRTLVRHEVGATEARAAGCALAELHLAGADYPDHRPGRYEPDEIDRRLHIIAAQKDDPSLASAVAILAPALAHLRKSRPPLPLGLIHGDLFIDNVLYDDTRLTALLDFEQASWGRLAYDLAVSVLAFGFGHDDFRADVTRAFIDGYRTVRAPDLAEHRAFSDELRFAACRFAVTRITDVYLRRGDGAPAGKDFWRYIKRLHAVERHLAERSGLFALV